MCDINTEVDAVDQNLNLCINDIIMLAHAVEYECNDNTYVLIGNILEKIEQELHVDTYVGNRLAEYGRIMGWSKE